ncbi:MAG TPA: hypothetical protein VMZ91_02005 [Candidatus Paceibacterota bacterium]|nr:hypothetical protein [Candidatus Paceibacterota bacterium]
MNKIITTKTMNSKTGFRCHKITPSVGNNRKKLVSDYNSRAIIFKNKADVIRVATAMLSLADTEEMEQEDTTLNITVMTNKHNEHGYSVTVVITAPNCE